MTEIINGMLVAARDSHLIVLVESRGQRATVKAPAIGIAMVKVKNGMFMLPPLARQQENDYYCQNAESHK
jgi:hypothetical protein